MTRQTMRWGGGEGGKERKKEKKSLGISSIKSTSFLTKRTSDCSIFQQQRFILEVIEVTSMIINERKCEPSIKTY